MQKQNRTAASHADISSDKCIMFQEHDFSQEKLMMKHFHKLLYNITTKKPNWSMGTSGSNGWQL
jgi:hypothetical protein